MNLEQPGKNSNPAEQQQGFTLLEVLVSLTVLALGAALVLSLISGSLGNIRKVQLKSRTIEHAQTVMETVLLDKSIEEPTTLTGDFEDGTRWSADRDYEFPSPMSCNCGRTIAAERRQNSSAIR